MTITQGRRSSADHSSQQALRDWLASAHDGNHPQLRIGVCGHLLLSAAEQAHARQQLSQTVLPQLLALGSERLTLVAGMAPGADLLFLETASDWLHARQLKFDIAAILPVPAEHLVGDWMLRHEQERLSVSRNSRRDLLGSVQAWLQRAHSVLPLYEHELGAGLLSSRAFRQRQYRRLAAILAQHVDVLVAITRSNSRHEPGGSAEVIAWRQDARLIPADLRLHPRHQTASALLITVDLSDSGMVDVSPAGSESDALHDALARAEIARRDGNAFLCHDIVRRALDAGQRHPRLDYLLIQSLANSGNTQRALDRYRELDLADDEEDEDWLALRGRLEKDLALRTNPRSWRQFARAADAYEKAWQRFGGSYSSINAASMRMLAGQTRQARKLAQHTVRQLENESANGAASDDSERYFRLVSVAEAALLLGDATGCQSALYQADQLLRDDITRRSRSHQQLWILCRHLQLDTAITDALHLPSVALLRMRGKRPRASQLRTLPAALQALIDQRALLHVVVQSRDHLRLCEQLQQGGAHLYLTLPAPAPELVRSWPARASRDSLQRLESLLSSVDGVVVQRGFLNRERSWRGNEAEALNLGLSILTAARLAMRWLTVDLQWHGKTLRCRRSEPLSELDRNAHTAFTLAPSIARSKAPAKRRMAGLIFADFSGFSRLSDPLFPRYYRDVIGGLARMLNRHGRHVLVRKTWGDALHVVTDDAASAAQIAVEVQGFVDNHRLRRQGMLGDLELRIAAHYAPVFCGVDAVEKMPAHFGTQLSFAARIEPVAPPGSIYVTENFAARLAFEAPRRFALEYAGEVELAKHFGAYRLYALRLNRGS